MSERSVQHSTFVLERTYDAPPQQVFDAWSSAAAKQRWFITEDDWRGDYRLDFRTGGQETLRGRMGDGPEFGYDATYLDIVPNERIVYAYTMDMNGARMSASLTAVELRAAAGGTHLKVTEYGVYLDGIDKPEYREHGIGEQLDAIASVLASEGSART